MFEQNQYYHIYNQGNNGRQLFFTNADYELFMFKSKSYILPLAKIIAYCLMPNHYHFFVYVEKASTGRKSMKKEIEKFHRQYLKDKRIVGRINPVRINVNLKNEMSLSDSIAIIQRSYSRSLNIKKGWTGSMFRCNYKVNDGWVEKFIDVNDKRFINDQAFLGNCIDYIHQNPVKAQLCKKAEDWKYSSIHDKIVFDRRQ